MQSLPVQVSSIASHRRWLTDGLADSTTVPENQTCTSFWVGWLIGWLVGWLVGWSGLAGLRSSLSDKITIAVNVICLLVYLFCCCLLELGLVWLVCVLVFLIRS